MKITAITPVYNDIEWVYNYKGTNKFTKNIIIKHFMMLFWVPLRFFSGTLYFKREYYYGHDSKNRLYKCYIDGNKEKILVD